MFFEWADDTGTYSNKVGDLSLSSGVLATNDDKIIAIPGVITSNSHLNQLTTAHNGYLTFAVEYGILISLILYSSVFLYFLEQLLIKIKINFQKLY